MKTINYILIIIASVSLLSKVKAQDATARLNVAQSAYTAHNLSDTRFALQEALDEINKSIGKNILEILPTIVSDISYNQKDDNVNGSAGYAGLFVNRTFGTSDGKNAKIEIMGDSPMVTSINAILGLPKFMSSDANGKRISVNGYKGLLKQDSAESDKVAYTAQIPLNQTLITFHLVGITAENDVLNILNSLPLDKIAKVSQ